MENAKLEFKIKAEIRENSKCEARIGKACNFTPVNAIILMANPLQCCHDHKHYTALFQECGFRICPYVKNVPIEF